MPRNRPGRRRPVAEALEARQLLAVITVTSAGDADGADGGVSLSLRQAIEVSDGTLAISALSKAQAALVSGSLSSPNTIDFAIASPSVIEPATALPAITKPVVIDGYSQPGAHANTGGPGQSKNTRILIALDGSKVPGASGLLIQAGGTTVQGLAIGGFSPGQSNSVGAGAGILIDAQTGDRIVGDFLGTDASGTVARSNFIGIEDDNASSDGSSHPPSNNTIGGTAPADGNLISGNTIEGIGLTGSGPFGGFGPGYSVDDLVEGNFIGTNATGVGPLPNGTGIQDDGGGSTIGGTAPGAGNLISGNGDGLLIHGYVYSFDRNAPSFADSADLVQGNRVGTDFTGNLPLPNGVGIVDDGGVSTIGGTASGAGNLISGNAGDGLKINGGAGVSIVPPARVRASDLVEGNLIGTDASGTLSLPNGGNGIFFTNNTGASTVGGTAAGAANVIAFNKGSGVAIKYALFSSPPTFQISGNSIDANGKQGISGSPARIPTLLSVTPSGSGSLITGAIDDNPIEPVLPYTIEFFANTTPDPSGSGQGQTYLGSISVTTDTVAHASFRFVTPVNLLGKSVSATAFGINGGTSDFSNDVLGYTVSTSTTLTGPGAAQFGQTFTLTATVAPTANGIPTGQVTFLSDGSPIGTSTLNASGVATLDTTILQPGSYTIQAEYLGDGTNSPSQSATTGLTILRYPSTTTLTGPSGTTPTGQPVTLTANVPVGDSGLVQFSADGIILGTSPLPPSGMATFTTSSLGSGPHVILAAYLGDLFDAPSQSSPILVTVGAPVASPTTTTLAGPSGLVTTGQAVTFIAAVQGLGGATVGVVAFAENGVLLDLAPVNASGVATFATTFPTPGAHVLQAAYLGDPAHSTSASNLAVASVFATYANTGPSVIAVASPTLNSVTIAFKGALAITNAQDPANYAIVGPDGKAVAIESVEYDLMDDSVTLVTRHPLKADHRYKVTVNGRRAGRIVGVDGLPLDGGHSGPAGSNFTATLTTGHAPKHPAKPPKAPSVHKIKK